MTVAAVRKTRKSSPPSKPLLVKHWMTPALHSIGKDQPLGIAHQLMKEHQLRHLPVLDHGKLVGVISERDLYYLESIAGVDVAVEPVEEGMSQDVYSTSPESSLQEVVLEMANQKYGCAVVVERGKAVGIFTTTDALRLLATLLGDR